MTSASAPEEESGDPVVVRYAFVYWYGGSTCSQNCSGAATEDGVIVSFAGRDKTSSSELGVELGIKVNLLTPRIREENVPRDGYGNTCLVHVRRDVMSDFASSLTWRCLVHARRDMTLDFASSLTWFGDVGPRTERCDVGFCFVFDMEMHWRARRDAMSDFASSLTWRCLVHAWKGATSDFAWRCLVRARRDVGVSLRPYLGW